MGTLRMKFVVNGFKMRAMAVGFVEVMIWITIISQVVRHMNHWIGFVAYAMGYSAGTWVGMKIEERLAFGTALVRVIPQHDASLLVERLRNSGYGVTCIAAEGSTGPITVLLTLVPRNHLPGVRQTIQEFNPRAFFTVEDVRQISHGIFPLQAETRPATRPGEPLEH